MKRPDYNNKADNKDNGNAIENNNNDGDNNNDDNNYTHL